MYAHTFTYEHFNFWFLKISKFQSTLIKLSEQWAHWISSQFVINKLILHYKPVDHELYTFHELFIGKRSILYQLSTVHNAHELRDMDWLSFQCGIFNVFFSLSLSPHLSLHMCTSHSLYKVTYQILIFNKCLILTAIMWLLLRFHLFITVLNWRRFIWMTHLANVPASQPFSLTEWMDDWLTDWLMFGALHFYVLFVWFLFHFVTSICLIMSQVQFN